MKIKYKNILFLAFSSFALASCNLTMDNKNARIETSIKNVKISSSLRSYDQCIEDGKNFDSGRFSCRTCVFAYSVCSAGFVVVWKIAWGYPL